MARNKFNWQRILIVNLVFINVFANALPHSTNPANDVSINEAIEILAKKSIRNINYTNDTIFNLFQNGLNRHIRPGQVVLNYDVQITPEENSFKGRAILAILLTQNTIGEPIKLYADDLNIDSVRAGALSGVNVVEVEFHVDDSILEIHPAILSSLQVVIIEYSGQYAVGARGLRKGTYQNGQSSYLSMNLHPTYARRVFPCVDEPSESAFIRFSYDNLDYTNVVSSSSLEANSQYEFALLLGPVHGWGLMAHNFNLLNVPAIQVFLYGRFGVFNQEIVASVALNFYFNYLNEWTGQRYFDLTQNQDERLHIFALPDVSSDSHALSTVGIWEPYVFMQAGHSVTQRKTALTEIALALTRQWFGYALFPENWQYEWITSGLATHAAIEMLKSFNDGFSGDTSVLDINTLFVTDIIQESLLRDAYALVATWPIEPSGYLFEANQIRYHVNGLLKYKSPAILSMLRTCLSDEGQDYIQGAARVLLRFMNNVNTARFIDAINSVRSTGGNVIINNVYEFLEPFIRTTGYPVLNVALTQQGVVLSQEHFSFVQTDNTIIQGIPITYTSSVTPDFSDYQPQSINTGSSVINIALGASDWVLFNIQGQGYYRVNYENVLWERIIVDLNNAQRRQIIHPLNRATVSSFFCGLELPKVCFDGPQEQNLMEK